MNYLIEQIHNFLSPLYDFLIGGLTSSTGVNILDGEFIRLNLTWEELPTLITFVLTSLFIILVVKLIFKILGVFIWR